MNITHLMMLHDIQKKCDRVTIDITHEETAVVAFVKKQALTAIVKEKPTKALVQCLEKIHSQL